MLSPLTQQLIDALSALPSIGKKSAQRIAFQLLTQPQRHTARQLANTLLNATEHIQLCTSCRLFSETPLCPLCSHPKRQPDRLCIVESPSDLLAIEHSQAFRGRYFILHGQLSPIDGIGPKELGLPALQQRIQNDAITELIVATSATMEGEATAHYLLKQCQEHHPTLTISRIAHGVPMGGELEYLDNHTLHHALQARTVLTHQNTTTPGVDDE